MKKWKEIRNRGERWYVWKLWGFYIGVVAHITTNLAMNFLLEDGVGIKWTTVALVVFVLSSAVVGKLLWELNEKRYLSGAHTRQS